MTRSPASASAARRAVEIWQSAPSFSTIIAPARPRAADHGSRLRAHAADTDVVTSSDVEARGLSCARLTSLARRDGERRAAHHQFYIAGDPRNDADVVFRSAARDPRQRERIEMKLAPAPGFEAGALATAMDIVIG